MSIGSWCLLDSLRDLEGLLRHVVVRIKVTVKLYDVLYSCHQGSCTARPVGFESHGGC
jgi:hypothetical protein